MERRRRHQSTQSLNLERHGTGDVNLQTSILQGTTHSRVELRQLKKDGTPIDILVSAAPLLDERDQISGIVAVIADITAQKQQAEKLRLLESVVVNTNDAVIITRS